MLTDEQILELRSHFPILKEKTYLYNCSQGALSDAVESGMQEYAQSWRTSSDPWGEWVGAYEALRAEFARFINAEPDEVAIVTSASAGINPIANALTFDERNKVVMGEYEFPTMGHIWLAQRARGAAVHFLDGVENEIPTERYERAIDDRTRIVPLTQVSFVNGFRSDVAAISRIAHANGALVFLDGYQDCGTRPMDVKALDVDFFVTGTLKYLLGNAQSYGDELDVAARCLRFPNEVSGPCALGAPLRDRHSGHPEYFHGAAGIGITDARGYAECRESNRASHARVSRRRASAWDREQDARYERRPSCGAPLERCGRDDREADGARHYGVGSSRWRAIRLPCVQYARRCSYGARCA
jgi:hypothetical protein